MGLKAAACNESERAGHTGCPADPEGMADRAKMEPSASDMASCAASWPLDRRTDRAGKLAKLGRLRRFAPEPEDNLLESSTLTDSLYGSDP